MMTTMPRIRPTRAPRGTRASTVAVLVLIGAFSLPSGASAEQATAPASRTAWFWESAEKVTTCTDDGVQNACGDVSPAKGVFGNAGGTGTPITQGHLGIGVRDGASDMRAYVKFDLSSIPFGATVDAFRATWNISEPDQTHTRQHSGATGAKAPATVNEDEASIRVCAVVTAWGSSEGDPPSSTTVIRPHPESGGNTEPQTTTTRAEPDVNCALSGTAEFSQNGKTLTADLTQIAQAWGAGTLMNEGIALLPVPQGRATWTVELHGLYNTVSSQSGTITFVTKDEAARAAAVYTPPVAPPPPPPEEDPGPQFPSFGNPIPVDQGPVIEPTFGDQAPPEQVPTEQPPAFVPVAERTGEAPAWFFGLFPLGLLIAGFIAGLIGTDTVTRTAVGAQSRVASVLRSRRLEDL